MRNTKTKEYRRQAGDWCFDFLMESFPEEVVKCTTRKELWNLAFPETHYNEICRHRWATGDDDPTYSRYRLFRMSPRWIYKQIKKNPSITKDELKRLPA